MKDLDDAATELSVILSGTLIDGTRLHKALRKAGRALLDKHAADGDIAAKHLLALEENAQLKAEIAELKKPKGS